MTGVAGGVAGGTGTTGAAADVAAGAGERRRIAVVGSGVAGLTAAYVLHKRHEVALYEADGRLGGHAHTHEIPGPDGRVQHVDSGFIVHNARTYPHLLRLFRELGVATQESEMSMSVRCEGCGLEYAGARGARGLFARPGNLARPRYLRMLAEIPRFHRLARRLLAHEGATDPGSPDRGGHALTLGAFLARGGFSPYFRTHFTTPLVSAVWSCPPPRRRCATPPATSSASCTTTACSPSAAHRRGAR